MKNAIILILLSLSLISCGKNPQERFAAICAKESDEFRKSSCLCTSTELAKQLDKSKYEKLVTNLEESQTREGTIDFSAVLKSDDLDKETITAFISSAKRCGPGR